MTRSALRVATAVAGSAIIFSAAPAHAGELYGGLYAHGVETPFTFDTGEGGADIQAGYRFDEIDALAAIGRPAPQIFASVNTQGHTSFVGAGLSWKAELGPVYIRPGVGLMVHNAPELRVDPESGMRTDLGSRVLFSPELAVGARLSQRLSAEASWVHISGARLFNNEQNPGIDMMGVRLNYRL
ncbi:MAG: hypothetical protein DI591_09295 [Citromicrobium sp.]|nr:MAG: hypothetical protein DI591_09295 [Citromicrobium sp.]